MTDIAVLQAELEELKSRRATATGAHMASINSGSSVEELNDLRAVEELNQLIRLKEEEIAAAQKAQ